MEEQNSYLTPAKDEVVKNRHFGMPITKMTRHQRVSFAAMIKIAYEYLLQDESKTSFTYPLNDFLELIGINTKSRKRSHLFTKVFDDEEGWEQEDDTVYSLERILKQLMSKTIGMRYKNDKKETYKVHESVLVSDFVLDRTNVTFSFGNWVRSNILTVGNAYIMSMPTYASLNGTYSVALYEQLEQRRDFRRWEVGVQNFRRIMGVEEGKYKALYDFKTTVINKSIDEINSKTKYVISFAQEKSGRSVSKFIFTWYIKEDKKESIFSQWKSFIRKNFIDIPLHKGRVGEDQNIHIIQVNNEGLLYNFNNPEFVYKIEDAKRIWKYLYDNQDKLLIKNKTKSDLEKSQDDVLKDYSMYIGKDLVLDGDLYQNIILIIPHKDKLRVQFYDGMMILLTEDDLKRDILFK